ncbi:MAG: hypothetical protein CMJ76_12940 [Planctomycetaceae bacterium]|nr:hypothetical protein [Planctomycetaceae bacterium]
MNYDDGFNTDSNHINSETIPPSPQTPNLSGETIGPYGVIRILGKGAMGIVYEAIDSKLDRRVAIKTLPTEFARKETRISRFKREATLLASLSHPNIATVFSHEQYNQQHCLVMEYIEGQGLDDVILKSQLTLQEILQIGLQISGALETAHNHGIVHRDLKPANIRLTSNFTVKVLDFGLAKNIRFESLGSAEDPTGQTAAGQVLGTPCYMSPEQARGRTVDKRTDLWAFGCILFEMLSGQRVFGGDNISDTLVQVLEREPDWTLLPVDTPGRLIKLVERCLQKHVDARLPDAGMIRIEIEELIGGHSALSNASAIRPTVLGKSRSQRLSFLFLCVFILSVSVFTGWLIRGAQLDSEAVPEPVSFAKPFYTSLQLKEPIVLGMESTACLQTCFAISPDGLTIVYSSGIRTAPLVVRKLDSFADVIIQGTEGAHSPFFSPDSEQIAFVQNEKLCVVHTDGGNVKTLADAEVGSAGAWQADGFIYYPTTEASTLWRIPETGGVREKLYLTFWGGCENPTALPDGSLVFTKKRNSIHDDYSETIVFNPEDKSVVSLGILGMHVEYCELGYLVYCRDGGLYARSFDVKTTTLSGNELAITSKVASNGITGNAHFDVSNNGTILFLEGRRIEQGYLSVMGPDGKVKRRLENFPAGSFGRFELSPNERYLALEIASESDDIWIYDLFEKTIRKVTNQGNNHLPLWTPDGKAIYFGSRVGERTGLYKMGAFGGNKEKLAEFDDWYIRVAFGSSTDIMLLERNNGIADASGVPDLENLTVENKHVNWGPVISPDDKWVAFVSDRTGRYEIFVAPMPLDVQNARQVSIDGGFFPTWSRDGGKIFYIYDNKFYQVNIDNKTSDALAAPEELFEHDWVGIPGRNYAPYGTDGDFIAVEPIEPDLPVERLKIIQNALLPGN